MKIDEVKNGQTVYVTTDFDKLKSAWEECECGPIDDSDLKSYLGCPGKILEVEDDDDTVNLEWVTKDTQWIPVDAVLKDLDPAKRRHAPFQATEMMNEDPRKMLTLDEVKVGEKVFVGTDFDHLKKQWAECECGPIDDKDLETYCGCPGKILEIEEDDDTVNLEWVTKDTQWIPIAACKRSLPAEQQRHAPFQATEMMNEDPRKMLTIDEVSVGEKVFVGTDFDLLKKQWAECECGPIDDKDLESYLGCPGKILEVEEDDDTINLEWVTKDTQWIPVAACKRSLPAEQQRHAPFQACEMVNEAHDLEYITPKDVTAGDQLFVTTDFKHLQKLWKEKLFAVPSEGANGKITPEDINAFCGCGGKVVKVSAAEELVDLKWATGDSQSIPIAACVKTLPADAQKYAPFEPSFPDGAGPIDASAPGEAEDCGHELIESELPVVDV